MKPKRRTKTAPNSRYRYGTSSSSEMSEVEEGTLGKNVGKDEKDSGFSKTKMAINMLSQQYLTRESSGCDADTENSTAESGQYDFEAENNLTLFVSPAKKKNKKLKKQPKKKANAKGKKQNKMDTENDQKLKRKFSALGISDSENSVNILSDKPVESKKARSSVVTFCLKDVENMDFDSPFEQSTGNAGSNESKGRSLFISPIGHVSAISEPGTGTFKMMGFTSIKETSTPAESKPVVESASSDDGCFGFSSIMTPEPEISPVRKISSMDYMMTGRSVSPTDLGSPELKPGRKLPTRSMETKSPERPILRRSKSSGLSSLMSLPPLTTETSSTDVVPRAVTCAMSSSPAPRRASKRLMKSIKCEEKCGGSPTANQQLKKKRQTKTFKDASVSLSTKHIDRSGGLMLTSVDSGIAMSFQDSNVSQTSPNKEYDIFALRVQSSTEESCQNLFQPDEPEISTQQSPCYSNPIRKLKSNHVTKLTAKPLRTSKPKKTGKKDDQHINQWASKINDEFSEIEMFDLVIST